MSVTAGAALLSNDEESAVSKDVRTRHEIALLAEMFRNGMAAREIAARFA